MAPPGSGVGGRAVADPGPARRLPVLGLALGQARLHQCFQVEPGTRILAQLYHPRRIACAALWGIPGQALLSQALDTGLLVLGTTGNGAVPVPGATSRYCLRHGCGPLVLVPASSA